MGKRFDGNSAVLFKLLNKGKCLDDLLKFEPVEPVERKEFSDLTFRCQQSDYQLNNTDKKRADELIGVLNEWQRDVQAYTQNTGVAVMRNEQLDYDDLCAYHPRFEAAADSIFQAVMPQAYYIPSVTSRVIKDTSKQLMEKMSSLMPDIPLENGIMFIDEVEVLGSPSWYVVYSISPEQFTGAILIPVPNRDSLLLFNFFHVDLTVSTKVYLGRNDQKEHLEQLTAAVGFSFASILFTHFFETEKVIAVQPVANTKRYSRATLNDEHYDSNLTYPINVIDAHWYTTIIRNDPFLVRGHFRRQPYGPGRGQYKIRWISAFMKHGYVRESQNQINIP